MTYILGSPVSFTHVLKRESVYLPEETGQAQNQKHWLPTPIEGCGILVGFRTKSNGYIESFPTSDSIFEGEDFGTYWNPTGYVKCAIVATSLYRNIIFVPLDSLKEES